MEVKGHPRVSSSLPFPLFMSNPLSLSPSPLSLLRAAFLRRYLTVVVNNPCYGFQMSLRPTLELGMGLERGTGVSVGHLL